MPWIRKLLGRLSLDQRGAAAVEFAIISPVFFALLVSITDIGRYMWTLNSMQYAIDEAVRAGTIQEMTDDQIKQRAKDALRAVNNAPVSVTVNSSTDSVTVNVQSTYNFMFPISSVLSGTNIDLRTEMPI